MMGKINNGGSAAGCIDYVTRKKKDKPNGSPCDEWRIIDSKDVFSLEDRREIIASFEDNISLNPKVSNPVGHISLNFHELDMDKVNDEIMVEIAGKYMERMGIKNTPYILVRHLDKAYPHCHLVYSRIDNSGKTISDKHDYSRNRHACIDLTKDYGLHISEGKKHTNVNKLRGSERIRYEIFNIVNGAWEDKSISSFDKFEARLKGSGVRIEYKYRNGTSEIQGLWYIRKGKRFPASKIDRRFSYGNICKHISKNRLRHPDSKWMYADGSIVPIHSYQGIKLSARQVEDYTAGKAIRVDGCQGELSTIFIKFNSTRKVPEIYSSNPDAPEQSITSSSGLPSNSASKQPTVDDEGCSVSGPDAETWPQFKALHPELTPKQALDAWRAKQRGKRLNGGFHMGI